MKNKTGLRASQGLRAQGLVLKWCLYSAAQNNVIAKHVQLTCRNYRKDTEPFYHSLIYSLVSLLSVTCPFHAIHSWIFTIKVYVAFVTLSKL